MNTISNNKFILQEASIININIDGVNTIKKFIENAVNLVEVAYNYKNGKLYSMNIWYSIDKMTELDGTATNVRTIRIGDDRELIARFNCPELGGIAIAGSDYISEETYESRRQVDLDVMDAYQELHDNDDVDDIHMLLINKDDIDKLQSDMMLVLDKVNSTKSGYIIEVM